MEREERADHDKIREVKVYETRAIQIPFLLNKNRNLRYREKNELDYCSIYSTAFSFLIHRILRES